MVRYYGDLAVGGNPPEKFAEALAVIGYELHPTFDRFYADDVSKDSCILVSLVLRNFLFRLGFADAEVRSVFFLLERRAATTMELVHNVGIGHPKKADANNRWNGHMVVVLPKTGWLIDATLYQARRKQWEDLPGMIATPIFDTGATFADLKPVTGFAARYPEGDTLSGIWFDNPANNRWRTAPDARRGGIRGQRRQMVSDALAAVMLLKGIHA